MYISATAAIYFEMQTFGMTLCYLVLFNTISFASKQYFLKEQDKSSDIEQQPSFGERKESNTKPQIRGGVQKQREHHIILTKSEAVHPTVVSENNSSSRMLII